MKSWFRTHSRSGFTLLEVLIFTAIFAVVSGTFFSLLRPLTQLQTKQGSLVEVNQQSRFLIQTIQRYVVESTVIELDAGVPTSTLVLRMPSSTDPVRIYASGTLVYLKVGTGSPELITTDRVNVSQLRFIKSSHVKSNDVLGVSFQIENLTSDPKRNFKQSINTSVGRVGAAIFASDLDPVTSLRLGVNFNDIQSVNRTLWFKDGNVGIGETASAPTEKLEVHEGGIRISSGVGVLPRCNALRQGLLWFKKDDAAGDAMTICIRSSTGTMAWVNEGLGFSVAEITVDNSENVGDEASMAVAKDDPNYVYISYYSRTSQNLRLAASTDGGKTWPTICVLDFTSSPRLGRYSSIVAPTKNNIYVSYFDSSNGNLMFIKSDNGVNNCQNWSTPSVLDAQGASDVGEYTSIAAPDINHIYISYYDPGTSGNDADLKFVRSLNGGGDWEVGQILDSVGNVGQYNSIAAPTTSTIYISYYDNTNGDLKFIYSNNHGAASQWSAPMTLDDGTGAIVSDVGARTSLLALDTNRIYVSYLSGDYAGSVNNRPYFKRSLSGPNGFEARVNLADDSYNGRWTTIASYDGSSIIVYYRNGEYIGSINLSQARSENGGAASPWTNSVILPPSGDRQDYDSVALNPNEFLVSLHYVNGYNHEVRVVRLVYRPPLFY